MPFVEIDINETIEKELQSDPEFRQAWDESREEYVRIPEETAKKNAKKTQKTEAVNMTQEQIAEFKRLLIDALVKDLHMEEQEARQAVADSHLSKMLEVDPDYIDHDTIEECADFVYKEYHGLFGKGSTEK